jgi:ABC-type glutathione transport system ATPase component
MDAVREFCDRVLLIEDSRVVAEGSAEVVAAKYTALLDEA